MNHWQTFAIAALVALVNIVGAILKHRAKRQEAERRRQRAAPPTAGGAADAAPMASRPTVPAPKPMQSNGGGSPRERLESAGVSQTGGPQLARREAPTVVLGAPGGPSITTRRAAPAEAPARAVRQIAPPVKPARVPRDARFTLLQEIVAAAGVGAKPDHAKSEASVPAPSQARPPHSLERARPSHAGTSLRASMLDREGLRQAVLLTEILGPPVALREP